MKEIGVLNQLQRSNRMKFKLLTILLFLLIWIPCYFIDFSLGDSEKKWDSSEWKEYSINNSAKWNVVDHKIPKYIFLNRYSQPKKAKSQIHIYALECLRYEA